MRDQRRGPQEWTGPGARRTGGSTAWMPSRRLSERPWMRPFRLRHLLAKSGENNHRPHGLPRVSANCARPGLPVFVAAGIPHSPSVFAVSSAPRFSCQHLGSPALTPDQINTASVSKDPEGAGLCLLLRNITRLSPDLLQTLCYQIQDFNTLYFNLLTFINY